MYSDISSRTTGTPVAFTFSSVLGKPIGTMTVPLMKRQLRQYASSSSTTIRVNSASSVELAKKGWYEITDIQTLSVQYVDTLTVPTIIDASNMLVSEDSATLNNSEEQDKRATTSFVDPRLVELSKQAQDASIN